MIKVTHTFNTAAEAQAHLGRFAEGSAAANATRYEAPAPQQPIHVAPAPVANQPVYNAPAPNVPYTPPAPPQNTQAAPAGGYAPPQAAPAPQQAMPASAAPITQAQLATAAQNYAKVYGAKAAKAKFTELGVTKISDIQPANYGYALQALTVQA